MQIGYLNILAVVFLNATLRYYFRFFVTTWHVCNEISLLVMNYFCLLFWMHVQHGRSHWRRNVGWGCSRTGCWRGYLGLRGERWKRIGEDYITGSCMMCSPHQILFGWSNVEEWDERDVVHVWKRGEVGKPEGKKSLGRPRRRWEKILRWIFRKWDGGWTGLFWLRTGTGGRCSSSTKFGEFLD